MTERIATAEWADPALVEEKYLYRDGTVWLGRSASDHGVPVGYTDDRHVCVVSGSRGGKGTTSIVNNLILWPGSICVVDPKGENATITASRRGNGSARCKGLGQAVQILDPFKSAQVEESLRGRFNPLDALDPANEESIDEAARIADAVVVIHEKNDPFWDESGRAMVKGLILHVLTSPEYEGRRNLITVRKLIMRGDWEAVEALRQAGEREADIPSAHALLWAALSNNPAFGGLVAGLGDSFTNMLLNGAKQYESVLQVANRNTEFIDSPAMQRCLEASDFQLSELKTRPGGLSVYLCLPQRYMSTHYRWLRMMIALTVTEMEKVRGRPATGYPILMVLDEFAGMKRMEVIENAVAQIAGYGVKLFFVLQSLEQIKAVYKDNWETFLANSGLKVFFNLEDHFSREYVSKLIGETEVIREVRSESDSVSESQSVSRSKGRSTSTGVSETEGTNRSVSTGRSWGVNDSTSKTWGASWGTNWTPGGFWGHRLSGGSDGKSRSQSESHGKSRGWTEGESHGSSQSTARSRTDGTSETEGTTSGTSQSRTAGMSETVHKRALVTPDEIGQLFARIDDRGRAAYPGLALVVISGARPVVVRRSNYFEDFLFLGLFDPPPDYPLTEPKSLTVESQDISPVFLSLFKPLGLCVTEWRIKEGMLVTAGEFAAIVSTKSGTAKAAIAVPHAGMITAVPGGKSAVPEGPLFSMLYYEDGSSMLDPFAPLAEFFGNVKAAFEQVERDLKHTIGKIKLWIAIAATVVAVIVAIAGSVRGSGIIVVLALVAYAVMVVPKEKELRDVRHNLRNFSEPASSWGQLARQPRALIAVPAAPPTSPGANSTIDNRDEPAPEPPALAAAPVEIAVSPASEIIQEAVIQPAAPTVAPVDTGSTADKKEEPVSQPFESATQPAESAVSSATVHATPTEANSREITASQDRKALIRLLLSVAGILILLVTIVVAIRRAAPVMVGKVNVSRFAGLRPGDTPERVASLHGQPGFDNGEVRVYDNGALTVNYTGNTVKSVHLTESNRVRDLVQSSIGDDALIDLIGKPEADVVAALGPPTRRAPRDADNYALYWDFSMPGRPSGEETRRFGEQTIILDFERSRSWALTITW